MKNGFKGKFIREQTLRPSFASYMFAMNFCADSWEKKFQHSLHKNEILHQFVEREVRRGEFGKGGEGKGGEEKERKEKEREAGGKEGGRKEGRKKYFLSKKSQERSGAG